VNAEFDWWLLFVGIAVGAGLVWFVLGEMRRRQEDIEADELPRQALWLSAAMADDGWTVPPEATTRLLELQREYLAAPPPDEPGQSWPAMTGSADGTGVSTSVSDTPNDAPASAVDTEGAGPTQ
jgi:hypothetical protein